MMEILNSSEFDLIYRLAIILIGIECLGRYIFSHIPKIINFIFKNIKKGLVLFISGIISIIDKENTRR